MNLLYSNEAGEVKNLPAKQTQAKKYRLDGEYGLWVEDRDNKLIIHWITMEADSGYLRVIRDDKLLYETRTPAGNAHVAEINKPVDKDLLIQYGSSQDRTNLFETTIFQDLYQRKKQSQYKNVDKIYAIGDVHGQYDRLIELLQKGDVIDDKLDWIAGKSHFVFLGDIFDRGHDVTKTLWFIYNLEKKAEKKGGKVHLLIGNHEILAFQNDLRYTSGKEKLIAHYHNTQYSNLFHPKNSVLGKWLTSKPGILKIDDILFAHGGVNPYYAQYSIDDFNDSLYTFLHEDEFLNLQDNPTSTVRGDSLLFARRFLFLMGEESVFWHRSYVLSDTLNKELDQVLERHKAALHVVGHSAVPTIQLKYDNKLVVVDLVKPVTEMLVLIRHGGKYKMYRYTIEGKREIL